MKYQAVDIRSVWDEIRPAIIDIHKKMPWSDWRPEDIYAACLSGQAAVFTQGDTEASKSFCVIRVDTCEQTGDKSLFIWIAWSPDEPGANAVFKDVDRMALDSGCKTIDFITGSHKLVQYAEKFGYKKVMYEVRKEL